MHRAVEDSITAIFRQRVSENPSGVALAYGARTLSYRELDEKSDALASELSGRGVGAGDVVALSMDRSAEMIVAMLGILKCKAAYMPLDRSHPVARLRYCLDLAGVKLIVGEHDVQHLLDETRKHYRFSAEALAAAPAPCLHEAPSGETAAYVMFTSGTTSDPKGVLVPHRAVTRLVVDTNYINISASDAILQFSTPSFDASTFEIWGALLNGATLALYLGTVLDPNLFKRHIVDHNITILWLTAALFHLFADKFIDALRPLRVLLAGGDVLRPDAVRKVIDHIDGITLINGYGPTENTTFTCCHVMTKENKPVETVPIGVPISGTGVLILDEHRRKVAPGDIGELYAIGRGVALGYLPAKAGDGSFFYAPELDQGLIYKTGDTVRSNERGCIEFIGRKDSQVKLRGYRISLEEVRNRLIQMSAVKEAAVICQTMEGGDQLLVAYLQTDEECTLEVMEVRNYMREHVPPYMIPDKILIGTNLPINSNGKIDSKKLFQPLFNAR
jgi:amino acid adenylation domain-containing protein